MVVRGEGSWELQWWECILFLKQVFGEGVIGFDEWIEWEAVVIGSYYVISGIGIAPFWQCLLFGRRRLINYWAIHFFISDTHGAVCTSEWPWAYETFHWTTFIAYGIPSSNIICNDIIESHALIQSRSLLSILWPWRALRQPRNEHRVRKEQMRYGQGCGGELRRSHQRNTLWLWSVPTKKLCKESKFLLLNHPF